MGKYTPTPLQYSTPYYLTWAKTPPTPGQKAVEKYRIEYGLIEESFQNWLRIKLLKKFEGVKLFIGLF